MDVVERIVAIDWSGRVDAAGQRRHIFSAVWERGRTAEKSKGLRANNSMGGGRGATLGARVRLENGRTREELADWLIELARETPRMVVSVDCCFSYPAWFLEEHGCATVFEFWEHVAAGHGERWLARECEDIRFWGKPRKKPAEFCGERMQRMMRLTDAENKMGALLTDPVRAAKMRGIAPKSPFQIGGSGSVGTGSLRAMPILLRLRAAGFRVWPYEASALGAVRAKPLLVEMYTRLLTGAVKKSSEEARRSYLLAKRKNDAGYAGLSRGVLGTAYESEDAFDALVCVVEMARHRGEFVGLRATRDPVRRLEGITWIPKS